MPRIFSKKQTVYSAMYSAVRRKITYRAAYQLTAFTPAFLQFFSVNLQTCLQSDS